MKKAIFIQLSNENISEISTQEISNVFREKYLYTSFLHLTEESEIKPTKQNIIDALIKVNEEKLSELYIHFIGNSTTSIDERNEYCQRGLICMGEVSDENILYDSELKTLLSNINVPMNIVFDCCYGNYGFNLNNTLKMIDGKFRKESANNAFAKKYFQNQRTNVLSMYFGEIKTTKYKDRFKKSGILSRRLIEILSKNLFTITIDQLIIQIYMSLVRELFLSHVIVYSSNVEYKGTELYMKNLGLKTKMNIKFIYWKSLEEIVCETKEYFESKTKEEKNKNNIIAIATNVNIPNAENKLSKITLANDQKLKNFSKQDKYNINDKKKVGLPPSEIMKKTIHKQPMHVRQNTVMLSLKKNLNPSPTTPTQSQSAQNQ